MLLTKEVEVKLLAGNVEHYKSLGYEIPMRPASEYMKKIKHKDFVYDIGSTILVKTEDLYKNSEVEVEIVCDYCGEIFRQKYNLYKRGMKTLQKNACHNCVPLKIKEINLLKYGVLCASQTEESKLKRKETIINKYGYKSTIEVPEIRQKMIDTCIERYGVSYGSQAEDIKQKRAETCLRNRGTLFPTQSEDVKEKVRLSVQKRYGVTNVSQSDEIKEKKSKTFHKNGSISTSSQQLYLHNLYGGELNFPLKYYNLDICFVDEKICIEYSGGGHNLSVKMGSVSQEEFRRKEIVRCAVIKNEGYKLMEITSKQDYLPSDEILLQMLEYTRKYFSDYPEHSWIEFNIDTSTVRNAEQKEGSFFDYGKLRKIKKSDLEECA